MGFRNSEEAKREKDGIIYFVRKNIKLKLAKVLGKKSLNFCKKSR